MATSAITLKSIDAARTAVENLKRQEGDAWQFLRAGASSGLKARKPNGLEPTNKSTTASEPAPKAPQPSHPPDKLAKSFQSDGDSRRKAPSFASFASAKVKAPPESVSTKGVLTVPKSPYGYQLSGFLCVFS
jgi:hypothetical protein